MMVAVVDQVLRTMTGIMAPITPFLSEEIHHFHNGASSDPSEGVKGAPSIFSAGWPTVDEQWNDDKTAADGRQLLKLRDASLVMIEEARQASHVKTSFEIEIDLVTEDANSQLASSCTLMHQSSPSCSTLPTSTWCRNAISSALQKLLCRLETMRMGVAIHVRRSRATNAHAVVLCERRAKVIAYANDASCRRRDCPLHHNALEQYKRHPFMNKAVCSSARLSNCLLEYRVLRSRQVILVA